MKILLLFMLIPFMSLSQVNYEPYSLRIDIDDNLKEKLYQFAISNESYSDIVKEAKSNFTWISDKKLRESRIKDKIVRESYSLTAIVFMKDRSTDSQDEVDFLLLNFGNEMKKQQKNWEALHKKIWAYLY